MTALTIVIIVLAVAAMFTFIVAADRVSRTSTRFRPHRREGNHGNSNRNRQ